MVADSTVANHIINETIHRVVGKGFYKGDVKDNNLTNLFMKATIDFVYFNQFSLKCNWNAVHSTVMEINHSPIKNLRYTVDENIVVYSDNWTSRNKKYEAYQALNQDENTDSEQMYYYKKYTVENRVYPLPFWFSCSKFIMIDGLIGTGLLNSMNNGLTASFIIADPNGTRSEDDIDAILKNIKFNYSGQENAGGIVYMNGNSKDDMVEIIPFPSNQNKENYEFISAMANEKILNGFGIVSPLLFGLTKDSGSLGNGTELEVANEILMNNYILPIREEILTQFNQVFNLTTIDLSQYEIIDGDFITPKENNIQ
jgi:hypothetical protein